MMGASEWARRGCEEPGEAGISARPGRRDALGRCLLHRAFCPRPGGGVAGRSPGASLCRRSPAGPQVPPKPQ